MLVAVPMNFMPMMMPSQLAFTCVDAALLIGIADAPRNQMQTAPQHALGYPEDEQQQQQQAFPCTNMLLHVASNAEIMNLQWPGQSHCAAAKVC